MANIVIDQVQLNAFTGAAWQINARVTSDDGYQASFSTVQPTNAAAVAINAAIVADGITAIEAAGASAVGLLDTKIILGGAA